jgi:hypothetical protein
VSEKEPNPAERARAEEALRRAVEGEPAQANLPEAMAAFEDQMARLRALRLDGAESAPGVRLRKER